MRTRAPLYVGVIAVGVAVLVAAAFPRVRQRPVDQAAQRGENDIGGVVTGPNGPEAGVWVIAETFDLPTKYVKIVVTDDRGRYLIPELPKANYSVWVRGYGLVDSPKLRGAPGACGGAVLSGRLLVFAHAHSGQE